MSSALWAGISGLNSSSKELDVIANNLANVNTIGFKAGKTQFSDILSSSISGGSGGNMQVGRGVSVADIQTQFGTGSFEATGNATDAAIDGDGFFMVNDSDGATYYTRAGAFHMDNSGVLVDNNGYKVQGKAIINGEPSGPLTDIKMQGLKSAPSTTTTVSLGANLNSSTVTGGQYNTSQTVYDSLGASHTLNTIFTKTEYNATGGCWGIEASLDSTQANALSADGVIFNSDGAMTGMYTGDAVAGAGTTSVTALRPGMIYKDTTAAITLTRTGGIWSVTSNGGYVHASIVSTAAVNPQVSLDGTGMADLTIVQAGVGDTTASFTLDNTTTAGLADIDIDLTNVVLSGGATIGNGNHVAWNILGDDALDITQYAAASNINAVSTDGYASGQLKGLSIDGDGRISGSFTNGQISELAQIVLAKFTNPWGLNKMGSNLFGQTIVSGAAIQDNPGNSGMGTLTPNSLEMSNTDIATEFIKMITSQKAYQASAKVVTTQDAIMQVLMSLKQ